MADTFNLRSSQTGRAHSGARDSFSIHNVIDFSEQNTGIADVVQVLDVYPGWFVDKVSVQVIVAAGATCVLDVGDGTDPDGYDIDVDAEVVTAYAVIGDGAYAAGKIYAAADSIDIVTSAAATVGKVVVKAHIIDMNMEDVPVDIG